MKNIEVIILLLLVSIQIIKSVKNESIPNENLEQGQKLHIKKQHKIPKNYRQLEEKTIDLIITDEDSDNNTFELDSLYSAYMDMDFTIIPQSFTYGEEGDWYFLCKKIEGNTSEEINLPYYFTVKEETQTSNSHVQLRLLNFYDTSIEVQCQVVLNDQDAFLAEVNSLSMTLSIYGPQRAELGTSKLFAIILGEQFLEDVLLAFNMPDSVTGVLIFDYVSQNTDLFPDHIEYSKQPYDRSYWSSQDAETILMPWIPYFSHCKGYGRHIVLYELLENEDKCNLVKQQDTIVVQSIPTTGLYPNADKCLYEDSDAIYCQFEEEMTSNYRGTKWWEATGQTFFYITSYAITIDNFIKYRQESSGGGSSKFTEMITDSNDDLIPVSFTAVDFQTNKIPSRVELNIKYNQISDSQKKITDAAVKLYDYKDYIDSKSGEKNFYNLVIKYQPMNFLELINAFQFPLYIYALLIVLLSIFLIICIFLFWLFNKCISRVQNAPILKFQETFKVAFIPGFIGSFLGNIVYLLLVLFTYEMYQIDVFSGIFYQYDQETITDTEYLRVQKGRSGLMLFIIGFFLLYYGATLIIPIPTQEQEKMINMQIIKFYNDKKKQQEFSDFDLNIDLDFSDDNQETIDNDFQKNTQDSKIKQLNLKNMNQNDEQNNEKIKQEKEAEEQKILQNINIPKSLKHKRYHYILTSFLSIGVFLLLLEFSYSEEFNQYLFYFLILYYFVDTIFISFLQIKILKENLLIQPISVALETLQFVMFLAANNFQYFVVAYLIRMLLNIIFRTYIDPIFKNVSFYWKKTATWITQKNPKFEKYLKKYTTQDNAEETIKFYLGTQNKKQYEFQEIQSLENVLNQLLSYSSKLQAIYLKPALMLVIKLFGRETQMPTLYAIKYEDFNFYFFFTFMIIIPQIIIDIFVLSSLELVHGFKLFDYLCYCKHRYETRNISWVAQNFYLDRSLNINYRSLDNINFSSQFYFLITISVYGLLSITLGVSIMLRNEYQFFNDPVLYPMVAFFTVIIIPAKIIAQYVWQKCEFWKVKTEKEKLPLESIDNILNQQMEKIEEIIEEDIVRKHFVQCNKLWIIQNMKEFLTVDNFYDNDEYLIQVYRKLQAEAKEQNRETRKMEIQQKKKQEKEQQQKMKENQKQDKQHQLISISKQQDQNLRDMLYLWYYQAKQVLYLKSLVKNFQQQKKKEESNCRICGIDIETELIEIIPFSQIMNTYRFKYTARPFNKQQFIKFYQKNQKFQTLCYECLEKINMKKNYRTKENFMNKMNKFDQISNFQEDQEKENKPKVAQIIVLNWLFKAKARLLISKQPMTLVQDQDKNYLEIDDTYKQNDFKN